MMLFMTHRLSSHISVTVNCSSLCVEHPPHFILRRYITILFLTFMKSAKCTKQVGSGGENL